MRLITPVIAVTLLALLSACDPGGSSPTPATPDSSSTDGSSSTPEPTETDAPEDEDPAAATIVITTSLLLVNDDDGSTLDHFDYFDSPTAAINALTEYFGGDPVVTPFEGSNHSWPGNFYTWDSFTLVDWVGGPGIPYGEDFGVRSASATVRGLHVETVSGITIGSTSAAVTAAGGVGGSYVYDGTTYAWMELDHLAVDNEFPDALVFVYVTLSGVGGTVTQLAAPAANFGP
jgi:hypothetical protein